MNEDLFVVVSSSLTKISYIMSRVRRGGRPLRPHRRRARRQNPLLGVTFLSSTTPCAEFPLLGRLPVDRYNLEGGSISRPLWL